LKPQFGVRDIVGESSKGKTRIVNDCIKTNFSCGDEGCEGFNLIGIGHVKGVDFDTIENACGASCFFNPIAMSEVAHGGKHAPAALRQRDSGEQTEAAAGAGDEGGSLGRHC